MNIDFNLDETHYLALDPGETTGYAAFNEKGKTIGFGHTKSIDELGQMLAQATPRVIIFENYKLRPWVAKSQSWSEMPAPKIIGAIELFASVTKAELVKQEPSCKETGYKWSGTSKAKDHRNSHFRDAYAHGVFYLIKQNIRKVTDYIDLG